MSRFTTHHLLPSFDDTVETAPLVSISLKQLENDDKSEEQRFFNACKDLGFFYLDMNGSELGEAIVQEAEALNALQKQFFALPKPEKDEFSKEKIDPFFAYRYRAMEWNDVDGTPARSESYNVRKDDILGYRDRLPIHPMLLERNDLFKSYTLHCRSVIDRLIRLLEIFLELPADTLAKMHRIDQPSGDHVRLTTTAIFPYSPERARRGEHTDYGTFTLLFNWLGGLQICVPDDQGVYTDQWVWVKPIPGSAVINLGDACVKFTSGILRSNIHRVTSPTGPQAGLVRNSLVYFSRPEDNSELKRLKGGLIDAQPKVAGEEDGILSKDWIRRRAGGDLTGVYTHKAGLDVRVYPGTVAAKVA